MFTEIPALSPDDSVVVTDASLRANHAVATLYHGDADLIRDFIQNPAQPLDIHGCIHHIHMTCEGNVFTLDISSMHGDSVAQLDRLSARELFIALAGVQSYTGNPNR